MDEPPESDVSERLLALQELLALGVIDTSDYTDETSSIQSGAAKESPVSRAAARRRLSFLRRLFGPEPEV